MLYVYSMESDNNYSFKGIEDAQQTNQELENINRKILTTAVS